MSGDYYKEWRARAEVDYFPQLVILWLSTNSWYRSHYSDIESRKDRDFLNKLREDRTGRNKLFARFRKLLEPDSPKEHAEFISSIEALHFALNRAELLWDEENLSSKISFGNCLITPNPRAYGSLVVNKHAPGINICETLKLTDDKSALFNGLLEIIYQVRCQLVHGQLNPEGDSHHHEVVKQCYFLLRALMNL